MERSAIPYARIKTMAFLVDGSDPIALRELLNYLHRYTEEGKKITKVITSKTYFNSRIKKGMKLYQ